MITDVLEFRLHQCATIFLGRSFERVLTCAKIVDNGCFAPTFRITS
ncbi:hypothetical protein USDA257_c20720 [Sinorhizobium fredii USDA 257]|uniref:Uncharacterized protein n=1 Tax=Sinorhizobium fredii (strain USDA 257) TaxID=1185652 RepID=I3X448_SINF2|nr:hypothetical protein USDA257_c20720 [Sinorhizobium fredii USDA 257]